MKSFLFLFCSSLIPAIVLSRSLSAELEKQSLEDDRVDLAFVSNGRLFSSFLPKLDPKEHQYWARIHGGDLSELYDWTPCKINEISLRGQQHSANFAYIGPCVPRWIGIPHWRIAHAHYWSSSPGSAEIMISRIGIQQLHLYGRSNKSPKGTEGQAKVDIDYMRLISAFNPLESVYKSYPRNALGETMPHKDIYDDFLPTAEDRVLEFIGVDGQIRTWQGKYKTNDQGKFYIEWNREVVETIEMAFSEPFYVWGKEPDLFFVTRSGRLYYSKKPTAGPRKMTALWTDGSRVLGPLYDRKSMSWKEQSKEKNPIRGLVFDADSNRGFAFTHPKPEDKDQRPMYFEIDAPLTPHPYPGLKLDAPPDNDTLRSLMEYTQFLIAKKEIKIKP